MNICYLSEIPRLGMYFQYMCMYCVCLSVLGVYISTFNVPY